MVPNYYDIQAAERSVEDDTALRQVLAWPSSLHCPCREGSRGVYAQNTEILQARCHGHAGPAAVHRECCITSCTVLELLDCMIPRRAARRCADCSWCHFRLLRKHDLVLTGAGDSGCAPDGARRALLCPEAAPKEPGAHPVPLGHQVLQNCPARSAFISAETIGILCETCSASKCALGPSATLHDFPCGLGLSGERVVFCGMQGGRRLMALGDCRHPASGYVQGINDLVTPFLAVFLSPHMEGTVGDETETEFPEEVR